MSANGRPSAASAEDEHSERMLRVLGWPGFTSKNGNPYTRLLYEHMEAEAAVEVDGFSLLEPLKKQYDVWHVHWPDSLLSYPSTLAATFYVVAELVLFAWVRLQGTKLVWTTHDLGPHESHHPRLENIFWALFIPMVDGIISLSETARQEAYSRFPQLQAVPSAVVPHGHYRTAYPPPPTKKEARDQLGLSLQERVIVFVGRIRPYKNVVPLIHAFQEWEDPDARLLIGGNPISDDLARRVAAAREGDERIRVDLRFIEEEKIVQLLSAADLVALPYEAIMHSGTALLALSFDRPVLMPDRGAMAELQERVGSEWMRTYTGKFTRDVLTDAVAWAETDDRSARAPLDDLDWPLLARQTDTLFRRVVGSHA
jgi:glycosyltransferase involved in cell wall biosynthesis